MLWFIRDTQPRHFSEKRESVSSGSGVPVTMVTVTRASPCPEVRAAALRALLTESSFGPTVTHSHSVTAEDALVLSLCVTHFCH